MTTRRGLVHLYLNETRRRQQVTLDQGGRTTTLRLARTRPVRVLEVPIDLGFRPGGALLLPEPAGGGPGALGAVAAALDDLEAHPQLHTLVAGHDPGGDERLGRRRAEGVLALLRGDREAWTARATEDAAEEDLRAYLAWVARSRGWPEVAADRDGLAGLRARQARPAGAPEAGPEDWRALCDLLHEALAAALLVEPAGLAALQALVRPVGPGAVGCAAAWPRDKVRIGDWPGTTDARLDILLFAERDRPALACHAGPASEWKACDLYRKGRYAADTARPAFVEPPLPPPITGPRIEVRVQSSKGLPLAGRLCKLLLPDGTNRGAVTDAEGWARADIAPHTTARVDLPELRGPG